MKKIKLQRRETCTCHKDDIRARSSSEIQTKSLIETAQVININKYVHINAAKARNTFERNFLVGDFSDQRTGKYCCASGAECT